jgi:hypothetical protein
MKKGLKGKTTITYIEQQMPNYANTQLYELIEHDENDVPVVYRGQTTQTLHKRLSSHRSNYKRWLKGEANYCTSFEVLKHGNASIELVRIVCCLNKKQANRAEGLFIREQPSCINIQKNYEKKEYCEKYYEANKEKIKAKTKGYRNANTEVLHVYHKEYRKKNKETIKASKAKKTTCECGAVICLGDIAKHRKTWKHTHDFIHL